MNAGESWDRRAFAFDRPACDRADPFYRIVMENAKPDRDFTDILDIGCGTGTYSLCFADTVRSVKGLDVSGEMIALARRNAEAMNVANAEFSVSDWETADVSGIGRFNLTIAHMTPAVHDGATLGKMLAVSSGWCFLAGYVSRENRTWDEIYRIYGRPSRNEYEKLTDTVETLWDLGKIPHLAQFRRRSYRKWTPEYAETFYIEAVRGFMGPDAEKEDELRGWVRGQSRGGFFEETSDPVIGVVYWDMTESCRSG